MPDEDGRWTDDDEKAREAILAPATGSSMCGERPLMVIVDEMEGDPVEIGKAMADRRGRIIAAGSPDGVDVDMPAIFQAAAERKPLTIAGVEYQPAPKHTPEKEI